MALDCLEGYHVRHGVAFGRRGKLDGLKREPCKAATLVLVRVHPGFVQRDSHMAMKNPASRPNW